MPFLPFSISGKSNQLMQITHDCFQFDSLTWVPAAGDWFCGQSVHPLQQLSVVCWTFGPLSIGQISPRLCRERELGKKSKSLYQNTADISIIQSSTYLQLGYKIQTSSVFKWWITVRISNGSEFKWSAYQVIRCDW